MRNIRAVVVVIVIAAFILFKNSHFSINDDQQAVLTQFGDVVKAYTDPGEHFKIPFMQKVHYFPKMPFDFTISANIPTIDKKFLKVETIIHWKIFDPVSHYKNLNDKIIVENRLYDIVLFAERNVIIPHKLDEVIAYESGQKSVKIRCNPQIEDEIVQISKSKLKEFGIELVNIETLVSYPN